MAARYWRPWCRSRDEAFADDGFDGCSLEEFLAWKAVQPHLRREELRRYEERLRRRDARLAAEHAAGKHPLFVDDCDACFERYQRSIRPGSDSTTDRSEAVPAVSVVHDPGRAEP